MQQLTRQFEGRQSPTLDGAKRHPGTRPILHHVQLKTNKLDAMIEWYAEVLDLIVCYRGSGAAWLTNDEANHRLALLSTPEADRRSGQGRPCGTASHRVGVRSPR